MLSKNAGTEQATALPPDYADGKHTRDMVDVDALESVGARYKLNGSSKQKTRGNQGDGGQREV